MAKKIHLELRDGTGGRSVCRYTARPSRRVTLLRLAEFLKLDKEAQCAECAAKAAHLANTTN